MLAPVAYLEGGVGKDVVFPSTDIAPTMDADDLGDRIERFVLDRWREFWPALVS